MERKLMDLPELKVYEEDKVWIYNLSRTKSGLPFYQCPRDKYRKAGSSYMKAVDECIFLPIDMTTFKTDRENYFYGYRFFIGSPGIKKLKSLSYEGDPLQEADVEFEVARIRYFMDEHFDYDISIDFIGDVFYPTTVYVARGTEEQLPNLVEDLISNILDYLCQWYVNRKI